MYNLNPKSVVKFINDGLGDGTFKNQAEIVAITGSGKSYVSEILAGKKNPGWDFVKRLENGLIHRISTKENISEPSEEYQITIHEPKKAELYIMERLLKAKDDMIEQLRAQLADKDEIISMLRNRKTPKQRDTAQGSKKGGRIVQMKLGLDRPPLTNIDTDSQNVI